MGGGRCILPPIFLPPKLTKGECFMTNPMNIYQDEKQKEDFVMIQGFVKSVTMHDTYASVSFKVNSEDSGPTAELISVMCFGNGCGINYKKLVEHTKGRFLTIFAVARFYNGKMNYVARAISIAPREFKELYDTSAMAEE